jgi:hypothetical protein
LQYKNGFAIRLESTLLSIVKFSDLDEDGSQLELKVVDEGFVVVAGELKQVEAVFRARIKVLEIKGLADLEQVFLLNKLTYLLC